MFYLSILGVAPMLKLEKVMLLFVRWGKIESS